MRRILLVMSVAALMAAMLVMSALPAFAQGQVERGPEHARSICSFSGLNDEPDDPVEGGRVQSFGQIVRHGELEPSVIKSGPPSPGSFCNPAKAPPFLVGPFGEPVH
jgi:hypothetical protein